MTVACKNFIATVMSELYFTWFKIKIRCDQKTLTSHEVNYEVKLVAYNKIHRNISINYIIIFHIC